jgi:hypothetical protein
MKFLKIHINLKYFLALLLFQLLACHAYAQGLGDKKIIKTNPEELKRMSDSMEQLTKERLSIIREKDIKVENKVVEELNRNRFNTLSRKYWGMPTEAAQQKINKGRYGRYRAPAGFDDLLKTPGRIHRHRKQILEEQNVIVWGWHPYYAGDAFRSYNFKLLTHVAYYAYELNPFTGGYQNFQAIFDFKNSELIPMAQKDSCKVLLTLSCHRSENAEIFFTSPRKVQQNLIDSLISVLDFAGGDGIEINFEEIPNEYKEDFLEFVKELSFQLREHNNNFTIAMTLPLYDTEKVYDMGFLQNWVDVFIISGFNFHLRPGGVGKGALSPLFSDDAAVRGSYLSYSQSTNLDSVLRSPGTIQSIQLIQNEDYMNKLLDTLNAFILASRIENLEYNKYELGDVLRVIQLYEPLLNNANIRQTLRRAACRVELAKYYQAQDRVNFFLFKPEWDTVSIYEFDVFNGLGGILSKTDTVTDDISRAVDRYARAIGKKHSSSLVLGLPYYGSVWQTRGPQEFLGYLSYAQIRNLIRNGTATVRYDKRRNTMIATVSDSIGPYQEIFFDNSTSLSLKIDKAFDMKLGGVAVWALSYDHGYNELWETLEERVAAKTVWNPETEKFETFKISKSNKIHYTVAYQMKRNANLIFATLVFITVFMAVGFVFSLLDWRVRDVMFYSGAFRIFYITIFTVLIMVLGSWLGLFQNHISAFLVGIMLGGILIWLATSLVNKNHEKLP